MQWCIDNKLILKELLCHDCSRPMKMKATTDRLDGFIWSCRYRIGDKNKEHRVECSIRSGSIFEGSNLSISEILQIIYWWSTDMSQKQIQQQMGLSKEAACSWHMKCREICEYVIIQNPKKLGGKEQFLDK